MAYAIKYVVDNPAGVSALHLQLDTTGEAIAIYKKNFYKVTQVNDNNTRIFTVTKNIPFYGEFVRTGTDLFSILEEGTDIISKLPPYQH